METVLSYVQCGVAVDRKRFQQETFNNCTEGLHTMVTPMDKLFQVAFSNYSKMSPNFLSVGNCICLAAAVKILGQAVARELPHASMYISWFT